MINQILPALPTPHHGESRSLILLLAGLFFFCESLSLGALDRRRSLGGRRAVAVAHAAGGGRWVVGGGQGGGRENGRGK